MAKQNLQSTIDNRQSNAFTIVELLVAMSLLVMLLGLSGMVFNTTVAAHRAAGASIDISRNLRAITEQLNADFRGLRTDAPFAIWFEQQWLDINDDNIPDMDELVYYDQIQFFADGDFQTTRQYFDGSADTTVYGNLARIYYGHAWIAETTPPDEAITKDYFDVLLRPEPDLAIDRGSLTLARRTHILTSNLNLPLYPDFAKFTSGGFPPLANDWYEYDQATLTNWKNLCFDTASCNQLLTACFNNTNDYTLGGRPKIDYNDFETLHLLLSQGVLQMQIQWAYTVEDLTTDETTYVPILIGNVNHFTGVRWWPSVDPDADKTTADSDFDAAAMKKSQFGIYFEMPGGTSNLDWYRVKPFIGETPAQMALQRGQTQIGYFRQDFYPKALKFTFVLRDSNGVFADGKTFTHIVYLDN